MYVRGVFGMTMIRDYFTDKAKREYEKRKKRDMTSADWYMLISLFITVWVLMLLRYWNN